MLKNVYYFFVINAFTGINVYYYFCNVYYILCRAEEDGTYLGDHGEPDEVGQ